MSLKNRIERYWNIRSKDFGKVRRLELKGKDAAEWLKIIRAHLPERENLKILDAGTGAGFFAILLSKIGHNVTGIDMSGEMIKEAEINLKEFNCRAELKKMDAQKLDFPDKNFDVIVSRNLTWTLPDVMQAYREWYRVLKPGGILINFDSDCGTIKFEKKSDEKDVHAGISDELIEECNSIKDDLKITTHKRPEFDVQFLQKIGFNVRFDEDISGKVHVDESCRYDSIPLFAIYAEKV